jgi:hypothetical protein
MIRLITPFLVTASASVAPASAQQRELLVLSPAMAGHRPAAPLRATPPTGAFRRTGYAVTGRATLAIDDGIARLEFSSDFSIGGAPGPFVYLSTTNTANTGHPLRVGALQRTVGSQTCTFQVPAGVRYTWVRIWCDPFNVGMADAPIPATP